MKHLLSRYLCFAAGIAINSFGVAFITKSALGTSPISSLPYVLSLRFSDFSFGMTTFLFNMVLILLQFLLLRKEFPPVQCLQIAANVLFSALIDVSMGILSFLQPELLPARLICLLIGCLILAFGICVEVAPDTIVVPGEGMVRVIARVSGIRFGTVKVLFDCTLMATAGVLSFLFFGRLNGLGAGTILSALLVGRFVNFFNRRLPLIETIRRLV